MDELNKWLRNGSVCMNCRFHHKTWPDDKYSHGECRRRDPRSRVARWPVARFHDWCGEFSKAENQKRTTSERK